MATKRKQAAKKSAKKSAKKNAPSRTRKPMRGCFCC